MHLIFAENQRFIVISPIYFIDPDGMVEVPYKSRYDAYGQKIDEQEAPIGNNTEILSDNKNDDNENKSSTTASGIEFDGVLGDRPGRVVLQIRCFYNLPS